MINNIIMDSHTQSLEPILKRAETIKNIDNNDVDMDEPISILRVEVFKNIFENTNDDEPISIYRVNVFKNINENIKLNNIDESKNKNKND